GRWRGGGPPKGRRGKSAGRAGAGRRPVPAPSRPQPGPGPQRPARVVVTRVPEHPAAAAPLVGPADLVADLRYAEDPPVERVVPEVLQPGAHAGRRVRRALADQDRKSVV